MNPSGDWSGRAPNGPARAQVARAEAAEAELARVLEELRRRGG